MRSAFALRIFSGRIIFISRLSRSAERDKRIFTGGSRGGKWQLQRRFLRKRGAAVSALALSVTFGDRLPLLSPAVTSSPGAGEVVPLRGSFYASVSQL